ncbi:RES family NAD+ phosphorylase [Paenibacillus amylolyticus]|uniref:RES family NAD+ phosphorylase n=1 Tax=Paenibacillus amylolyticus TaxID=1451 RepID=UPI0033993B77
MVKGTQDLLINYSNASKGIKQYSELTRFSTQLTSAVESVGSIEDISALSLISDKVMNLYPIMKDSNWSYINEHLDRSLVAINAIEKYYPFNVINKVYGQAPPNPSQISTYTEAINLVEKIYKVMGKGWGDHLKFPQIPDNIVTANQEFTTYMDTFVDEDYSYKTTGSNINKIQSLVSTKYNVEAPIEELKRAFGLNKLFEISEEDMVSFLGRLQRYPMLALEHRVGKRIYNAVEEMSETKEIRGSIYRCRTRNTHEIPWSEFEMWQAPPGVSSQGRFNAEGRGFLYLSRDPEVSVAEMKQTSVTTYDIMELECNAKIKVIDLTKFEELNLFRYCMFEANSKNKKEYLVPNFLAQCCELKGIKAIKYKSIFNPEINNYVFFDYLTEWFKLVRNTSIRI